MPQLQNFPNAQQEDPNSCWASAGRAINNYFQARRQSGRNPQYASDQDFANAWSAVTGNAANANISVQQSAAAALGDVGYVNNTDGAPFPQQNEIDAEITAGRPMLAIVGPNNPNGVRNNNYRQGHWVVIVGIANGNISVFDPDNGAINVVAYDANVYANGQYWQNTSYVDAQ